MTREEKTFVHDAGHVAAMSPERRQDQIILGLCGIALREAVRADEAEKKAAAATIARQIPEPQVDEWGVPWCRPGCQCNGGEGRSGKFCAAADANCCHPGAMCLPAVRAMGHEGAERMKAEYIERTKPRSSRPPFPGPPDPWQKNPADDEAFLVRFLEAIPLGFRAVEDVTRAVKIALSRGERIKEYESICRKLTQGGVDGIAGATLRPYNPPAPRFIRCRDCDAWQIPGGADGMRECCLLSIARVPVIREDGLRLRQMTDGGYGCCEGVPKVKPAP